MMTDIFQFNLFDWFAIWGAILIALLLLLWFARDPNPRDEGRRGNADRRVLPNRSCGNAWRQAAAHRTRP